ncbi:colorectal mutant cancer protein [Contarinia nasturtii]|uniref:colorectal mutant cancer protein n=1 Tax=Contarinia nasturtii TaxID=265458 RepID=UPI0012D4647C|nr:colorectal mutant cancer protein [Contarinia nasturtii]
MSEFKEVDDRKFGQQYVLNSSDFSGNNIDAEELANACRRLGISGPLEPLLRDLKKKNDKYATPSSPAISKDYNKESPRKTSQRKEKRTSSNCKTRHSPEFQPFEPFDTRNGGGGGSGCGSGGFGKNSYGKESWGRDSGARDLSPEPNMHRLHETLSAESQPIDTETGGGTSAMLHLASKLQVAALSALETEVVELSERLKISEQQRDLIQKKLNEALDDKERTQRRLESIGSAHESRITEMHCVIVELNKKLKFQQENAIIEDQEPDGSRSVSELSFQEGSVYNSEMECINYEQQSQTEPLDVKLEQAEEKTESHYSMPQIAANVGGGQVQIQAMQEEILYLRSHMALLQSKLASIQDNVDNVDVDSGAGKGNDFEHLRVSPNARSNYTSDDLCETAEIFDISQHLDETAAAAAVMKAQKYKHKLQQKLTVSHGLCDSFSSLSGNHTKQRACESIRLNHKNVDSSDNTNHKENEQCTDGADGDAKIQRLQRCIDHLRVQNNLLSLNLGDSKAHCEHLYLLCGKYESNAIALNQALNLSDRTIEAYDVMLALLESKLAILEHAHSAIENRKAAESVAKRLMVRLENDKNNQGNSLGPWQDAASVMYGSGGGSNNDHNAWTDEDDQKLRDQMSKLKGQRAAVQNTVVNLESPYKDYDAIMTNSQKMNDHIQCNRKSEIEMAVLMEELMGVRENFNDMKYRAEQSEREKNLALEALIHLQAQLADSEALLAISNKERGASYTDAEHTAGIELELVEALARESRLKARLQALASSLETATKSSEEKYASTVAELRQANLSLTQSLDRCKRKYQARLKRMEQHLKELSLKRDAESGEKILVPETTL